MLGDLEMTPENQANLAAAISLAALAVVGHVVSSRARKRFDQKTFRSKLGYHLAPLTAPLLVAATAVVLGAIWKEVGFEQTYTRLVFRIGLLWAGICVLTALSGKSWGGYLAVAAIVTVSALSGLGIWDNVVTTLDKYAFTLGTLNISLYRALKAGLLLVLLFWLAGALVRPFEGYLQRVKQIRKSNREVLLQIFRILVYSVIFLVFLNILGISLTTLTVFGGALGVGIGFGLQKITSNFVSGIILLFEKSVEEDDLIELTDGTLGFIKHTSARYTLVETFDSKEIMIPNEDFITQRVTNWTYSNSTGRVEIRVGVSYGSDIDKAHDLMLEAANEYERSCKTPKPICYLTEFGDSSVNFLLHFWVEDVRIGRYLPQSEVMFKIWRKFKDNGIQIPFPQRDLHLKTGFTGQERPDLTLDSRGDE